jgi:hypothetical protein
MVVATSAEPITPGEKIRLSVKDADNEGNAPLRKKSAVGRSL